MQTTVIATIQDTTVAFIASWLSPAAAPPASGTRETDGADTDVAVEFVNVGGLTITKEVLVLRASAEEVESVGVLGVRTGLDLLDSLDDRWDDEDDCGDRKVDEVVRVEVGRNEGTGLEVVVAAFPPTVVGATMEVGVEDFASGGPCPSPPRSTDKAKPAAADRKPLFFSKLLTSSFPPAEGIPLSPFPVASW